MEQFVRFHQSMSQLSNKQFTDFLNQSLINCGRSFFEAALFKHLTSCIKEYGLKIAQDMEQIMNKIQLQSQNSSLAISKEQMPSPMTLVNIPGAIIQSFGSYLDFSSVLALEKACRDMFFALRTPCSSLREIYIRINAETSIAKSVAGNVTFDSFLRFQKVNKAVLVFKDSKINCNEIYSEIKHIAQNVTDLRLLASTTVWFGFSDIPIFPALQTLDIDGFPLRILLSENKHKHFFNAQLKKLSLDLRASPQHNIINAIKFCISLRHLSLEMYYNDYPLESDEMSELANAMKHLRILEIGRLFGGIGEQLMFYVSNQLLSLHTPCHSYYIQNDSKMEDEKKCFQGCKNLKELCIKPKDNDPQVLKNILDSAPELQRIYICVDDLKYNRLRTKDAQYLVGCMFGKESLVSVEFQCEMESADLLMKYFSDVKIKHRKQLMTKIVFSKQSSRFCFDDKNMCAFVDSMNKTIDKWLIVIEMYNLDDYRKKCSAKEMSDWMEMYLDNSLKALTVNFPLIHWNVKYNICEISNKDLSKIKIDGSDWIEKCSCCE